MKGQKLKNSIFQMAIQGKLVPQDPNEEPASVLLEKIRVEKARLVKEGKLKKKDLVETPISPDEIPFDIPEGWEWCRLQDLVSNRAGLAYDKGNLDFKTESMIRVLRGGNITNGSWSIKDDDVKIASTFVNEELLLKKGTFITPAVTSLENMGKTALIESDQKDIVVGGFVLMLQMHLVLDVFDHYLLYFFQTQYFKKSCQKIANKSGQAFYNLSRQKMSQMLVPLPPLSEQQRIVRKIEELMPKVDEYNKAQETLNKLNASLPDKLRQSILQEAIQGRLVPQDPHDEPASILLDKIRKEKACLVKEGKLKKKDLVEKPISPDEIPFDIPEGWEWCRMSYLGYMERGSGIKRDETTREGLPCIRYGEIYTSYLYNFSETKSFVPKIIYDKCKRITKGDLVFTLTGENNIDIAKTLAYHGNIEVAAGGDLAIWKAHCCCSDFLSYMMYAPFMISQKSSGSSGNIIVHTSTSKVGDFLFPLPPLNEQYRIVEKIKELMPKIDRLVK